VKTNPACSPKTFIITYQTAQCPNIVEKEEKQTKIKWERMWENKGKELHV
jgi:hypothetical protein